jgi:hypothetical protein
MASMLKTPAGFPLNAPTVSLRNGFWFYFNEVEPRIVVFSSAVNGREAVLVDEEIVSEKRVLFSRTGIHHFEHQGSAWTVTVALTNLWTGEITCTVFRNGVEVAKSTKAYLDRKRKLWPPFLIGAVCGALFWVVLRKLALFG